LSNFVAIVLGSAASLWVVGMRGSRDIYPVNHWERRWVLGFLAASACLAVFLAVRGNDSQLHASPIAGAEDQASHLTRPAEVDAARPLDPPDAPPPSQANGASAKDQPAEDGGEIRFVLKPPAANKDGSSTPEMTIVIPSGRRGEDQADPKPRTGQEKPDTQRRRPLLRILREGRDLFRPRQRDDDR
ncbi:MAG: hypothetical protein OES79_06820, partial [Planctomycetota bacterium]|nr:hypothetical protein [Planctomycetota bacterium]